MLLLAQTDWSSLGVLVLYSAAIVLASIFGGLIPEWIRLTHIRMQLLISFVGGIMLGVAVFHMIPHALVASDGQVDLVVQGLMLGLLATFFLLRFFHFHQHGPADFGILAEEQRQAKNGQETDLCSEHNRPEHGNHGEVCNYDHGSVGGNARWVSVLLGLGLHTLTDGVAIGSGVVFERGHWLPGLGIFLAVLLHKPLDAISITSLMHPVTTPNQRLFVNIGFALMCPVGAFAFWSFASGPPESGSSAQLVAAWGLAFSAGVFLCIALSDLLPEMEFHSHSRLSLTAALLLGIASALAIGILEGQGSHNLLPSSQVVEQIGEPE